MNPKALAAISLALSLGALRAGAATPQHPGSPLKNASAHSALAGTKMMSHDHMLMANEPHHVLAMAYHQNLGVFAQALKEQTAGGGPVDKEFARAAATEMRLSFDQMKQHHQQHMRTMSPEMTANMIGMKQTMETHQAELDTQLTALERETKSDAPDAKRISSLAASVRTHLDAMSQLHPVARASKSKAKM